MTLRYVEKFTNIAGTISYEFPLGLYEWETSQVLRTATGQAIGADYAHDHHGYAPSPFAPSRERIRVTAFEITTALLEAAMDEARAECYRIGLGYLYRLDSDGSTRRRALARLGSMPGFTRQVGQSVHIPLIFDFLRVGPWMSATSVTGSQKVDANPETFNITNDGNLPCDAIVFRFRSDGTGPTTDLSLTNTTNGMSFSTTRDLSHADHELRVNTETWAVEYSANDGSSYANDYSLFSTGAAQVGIMRLEPGVNAMSAAVASGTPDYTLEWEFTPRWA